MVSKTLSAVSNDSGTYCLLGIKCLLECISENAERFAKFLLKIKSKCSSFAISLYRLVE